LLAVLQAKPVHLAREGERRVLFAATAAASVLLQNRMNYRFDLIVQDQLPLNAASETIDVATDAYELGLLRRAIGLSHGGAAAAAGTSDIEAGGRRLARNKQIAALVSWPLSTHLGHTCAVRRTPVD
jgi:hypothetical protein